MCIKCTLYNATSNYPESKYFAKHHGMPQCVLEVPNSIVAFRLSSTVEKGQVISRRY